MAIEEHKTGWTSKIRSFFGNTNQPQAWSRHELESLLYASDLSIALIQSLLMDVESMLKKGKQATLETLFEKTKSKLLPIHQQPFVMEAPCVVLLLGINGSGKTTTAARLAYALKNQGKSVLLAAGDTFRAGAIDQLQHWANLVDVPCIAGNYGADPASVIFDGWVKAKEQRAILIADTAGRLHTQAPLMEQLKKIKRVLEKDEDLNIKTLLVLDGTSGQNALIQSKEFTKDMPIDGLIVTKLDGSSKGGAVISSSLELQVPIVYVGVGEQPTDLKVFEVEPFLKSFYGI